MSYPSAFSIMIEEAKQNAARLERWAANLKDPDRAEYVARAEDYRLILRALEALEQRSR